MWVKKILLLYLFVALSWGALWAQNPYVDSLQARLASSSPSRQSIDLLNELAEIFMAIDPRNSRDFLQQSTQLHDQLSQKGDSYAAGKGYSLNLWALLAIYEGDYAKAESYTYRANQQAIQSRSTKLEAKIYQTRAQLKIVQGDYADAFDYALTALRLSEQLQDRLLQAEAHYTLGKVYNALQKYPEALKAFQQVLRLLPHKQSPVLLAKTYNNIGDTHLRQKQYHQARTALNTAFQLNDSLGYQAGKAANLITIGEIYAAQENHYKALEYYQKAFELDQARNSRYEIIYDYNNFGEAYQALNDYTRAIEYHQRARRAAEEIGLRNELLRASKGLADSYAAQNNYRQAYYHHKQYTALREQIFGKDATEQLLDLRSRLDKASLKEKIKSLEQEKTLQQANERQQTTLAYSALIGLGLALIIVVLLVLNIRQAKRSNQLLETQKAAIEAQRADILQKNIEIEAQRDILRDKNDEIERQNLDITNSLRYAQHIQQAMLPLPERISRLIPEFFILLKPKAIVSGDFYWYSEIDPSPIFTPAPANTPASVQSIFQGFDGRKCLIACVDCTGHGVPGAFMSMIGNELLHQIVNDRRIHCPKQILEALHTGVRAALKQEDSGNDDGMDIALCLIDPSNQTLEFAGAKSRILLVSPSRVQEVKGGHKPVGGRQRETYRQFEKQTLAIAPDTTLYMFTDGYEDQFGGANGKKFMRNQLKELLVSIAPLPMPEQRKRLEQRFTHWRQGHEQMDDVLVMGFRMQFNHIDDEEL